MRALSSFLLFTFPIARGLSYLIPPIKRSVSAHTDTLLMCAPTPTTTTTTWTTTIDPTHHQEKEEQKMILTARSKLSLLLRRCLTPATIQHLQPNLQGLQTYRRIQPLALHNGCGPTTKDSLWSPPDNRQYNTGMYQNIPNTGR